MTFPSDQELFRIFQDAETPAKARRALFEAGQKAEREGSDDVSEADEYLRSLKQNYEVRA